MESARWLVLSPLVVAVAAGSLGPARLGAALAGEAPWDPPPCRAEAAGPPGGTTWYRLDPVLDRTGTLTARRLTVGVAGGATRHLDLAPESFASGPLGGTVLAGEDDGRTSRLRLLDPARGCATAVADEAAVIRSAIRAADGSTIYEHRVDRATRADLGVWRRRAGEGATRVLDGLAADPRLGPTFMTDLVVAADGRLAVSSCAPAGCRVRVWDPASGASAMVRDTGPAVGVSGDAVIVLAACGGSPCAVEAVDLATGRRSTLAADAYAATLAGQADERLVVESGDGTVTSIDVASGRPGPAIPAAGTPLRAGSTASAGADAPPGAVTVAVGGRPDGTNLRRLDPSTGATGRLPEDAR